MRDKVITLDVRGRTFKIGFVSNYVTINFAKIDEKIRIANEYRTKSNEITSKVQQGKMTFDEGKAQLEGFTSELNEVTEGVIESRFDLVREILTTNDYEYDEKFWQRKTTPADLNAFLYACYTKDFSEKEIADANDGKKN